ncbi:potassium channel protein [Ornithinibacillus sp. L9]|uniref:Potassium channel protein n=1 Tax=Ornithinibacillus caprae TaxID=2678566 RepID=A0A6N8FKN0_9BACI|nr:potassium channel family protein [Ornithinibacillus caprae]MUK90035.1 potassium channel protein [Ornithinibacillus caprae]
MNIEQFKHIYFRLPVIARLLLTIVIVMLVFGSVIHLVEPEQFPTIFDGIWWAIVTGSTVGYGDYVPLSTAGRLIGILLILTGGGVITFYIALFSAFTVKHEKDLSDGKVAYQGMNHIVFVGWNERTKKLIEITKKHKQKTEIILIDQTLTNVPYQQYPIHFIKGDATDDIVLEKANIKHASRVVITADATNNERQADHFTILATVAIRGNNREVPIIVEILTTNQVENAIRAGANTVLRPNDFISSLLYHELYKTKSKPFETIIQLLANNQLHHYELPKELEDKPFLYVLQEFKKDDCLLIGIIRDNEWKLNPKAELKLIKNDILVTLESW